MAWVNFMYDTACWLGIPLIDGDVETGLKIAPEIGIQIDIELAKEHNGNRQKMGMNLSMEEAWNRASATYLARRGDDVHAVSYGNLAPDEGELLLLGPSLDSVRGLRVLDVGCGGGQNAVACALAGALVVGVDLSRAQLAAAEALSKAHGVHVVWQHGNGADVDVRRFAPFDLVLATQVLPYVDDPFGALCHWHGLLRPGGRLVVSVDHPVHDCFYDAEMDELSPFPVRRYDDMEPLLWHFKPEMPMRSHHRMIGGWIEWILGAGFSLTRVVEVLAPEALQDELWPEDSPLAPLRNIPHTAIFVATA